MFFEDASHFHQNHKVIKHIQKHRHPQKSNYHKSVFFFFLIFTKPYCQTERSRGRLAKKKENHTLVHQSRLNIPKTPFHKNIWGKHFYKKKDKKEAKGLFRVFKKASSSLRFRIKSPPIHFQNHHIHLAFPQTHMGSILSEKLAFLKPSTRQDGFLFFPFFFCKNVCGASRFPITFRAITKERRRKLTC